jgi:SEC-C motif
MKVGKNSLCPCGSGRKFKNCCGKNQRRDPLAPNDVVFTNIREREAARIREFGAVRPVIHTNFQGRKVVAVGNTLYASEKWNTFPDFLFDYVKGNLIRLYGMDWVTDELAKPLERRHPIMRWSTALGELKWESARGQSGIFETKPDGPSTAFLLLAYELYTLDHHQHLQETLLLRMKDLNGFRGARYEVTVAATMIRAGFALQFEDEGDNRRKHPEFIATNAETGEVVAVEAKSRGRSGVMGWIGPRTDSSEFRLGINDLLRNAIRKRPNFPYVIFIDANIPPDIAVNEQEHWIEEARESIRCLGHGFHKFGIFEGAPFTALFLTNFPHDWGDRGAPDPARHVFVSWPERPRLPFIHPNTLGAIENACNQYGQVPQMFS